jgi:hypothetical protein
MSNAMTQGSIRVLVTSVAFFAPILLATASAVPALGVDIFPPWQYGTNNDAINLGFEFTVPEVDDLADFHGDITDPKLVLYVRRSLDHARHAQTPARMMSSLGFDPLAEAAEVAERFDRASFDSTPVIGTV